MNRLFCSLTLWTAGALAVAATAGCDSTANGMTIPNRDSEALEILLGVNESDTAPVAPVTPGGKVLRKDCKECNGTGTITHGDGHKTACPHCYVAAPAHAAAQSACTCGENCTCTNCPSDCLGEFVNLQDDTPLIAPAINKPGEITEPKLQLAANFNAAKQPSRTCDENGCRINGKSSGGDCASGGSGSCGSGGCSSGGGGGHGGFMDRGPARRIINRVRPLRRAAGFLNRVRPLRRLGGCLFGRCG